MAPLKTHLVLCEAHAIMSEGTKAAVTPQFIVANRLALSAGLYDDAWVTPKHKLL